MTTHYKEHPLASLFPLMEGAAFDELVADIRKNGQRAPAVLCEGKLLDGRNRVRACQLIGVEPRVRNLNGEDPLSFVLSSNFHRRHLTESQRALIAAEAAGLSKGRQPIDSKGSENASRDAFKSPLLKPSQKRQLSQTQAANMAGVSRSSVQRAAEVVREAPKKEIEKIRAGAKTVTEVAREVKAKKEKPAQRLDKTGHPIPEAILSDWDRAEAFAETLRNLSRIKTTVADGIEERDVIFREVTNTTIATLQNAYGDLKRVLPHVVCPTCQGRNQKKCTLCKGRGFISKFMYDTCVPEQTKQIREAAKK